MSVAASLDARSEANERFFAAEAPRLARLCLRMAERFERGGRLLAVAESPQDRSDAHHVAVEFVHPVIVGKRALPALAVDSPLGLLVRPDDMVIAFGGGDVGDEVLRVELDPPVADPFVRQEVVETAYHQLWEHVHVFFDHLAVSSAGAGASSFLYPFLQRAQSDLEPVVEDVRVSMLMKAEEIGALRVRTLEEGAPEIEAAAASLRASFDRGGKLLAFGNGGSATDAMDVVADFVVPPYPWPARPAIDLTADSAVLTALANDVGPEVLFQRQVIAHGSAGDVALAISTSGGSANVIEALAEARRRGLVTVALVGYDGGRIAAEGLADHVVVVRSEHIPRIQEAQASVYHVLRGLVER